MKKNMKKTLLAGGLLVVMLLAGSNSADAKVAKNFNAWQDYNWTSKILKVYYSDKDATNLCFAGPVEEYNGRCTSTPHPTSEYLMNVAKKDRNNK